MSLINEDGTGLATAESYISVAACLLYHSNRGNTLWATITTAQQEQALRRATDYMLQEYRSRWLGRRVLTTQALDWPRVGVVIEDFNGSQSFGNMGSYGLFQVSYTIVPIEVQNACAELALRAAAGALADDLGPKIVSETVGPIKTDYDPYSQSFIRYRAVDNMIRAYLISGGSNNMIKMVRS